MRRFTNENRYVSNAPAIFAREDEAKREIISIKVLEGRIDEEVMMKIAVQIELENAGEALPVHDHHEQSEAHDREPASEAHQGQDARKRLRESRGGGGHARHAMVETRWLPRARSSGMRLPYTSR
jgi:hypothetical protein